MLPQGKDAPSQGKTTDQYPTPYRPAYLHPMFKPANAPAAAQPSNPSPVQSAPPSQPAQQIKNPFAIDPNVQKLISSGVCGEHRMKPKAASVLLSPAGPTASSSTVPPVQKRKSELDSFLSRMTELVEDTFGAGLATAQTEKDVRFFCEFTLFVSDLVVVSLQEDGARFCQSGTQRYLRPVQLYDHRNALQVSHLPRLGRLRPLLPCYQPFASRAYLCASGKGCRLALAG